MENFYYLVLKHIGIVNMKKINTYIIEKFRITKNTNTYDYYQKSLVVFLPYNRIQFSDKYLIYDDKETHTNVYVFTLDELKDEYSSHPGKYTDYYVSKLDKKYFNEVLDDLLSSKNSRINRNKLSISGTGHFASTLIGTSKYMSVI